MAWSTGTITSATPHAALNTAIKALFGGSGVANWSFVENIPAGTGANQSGSASYSVDVYKCAGSGTNANSAGVDFYAAFALPTSGADTIRFFVCESYDATNKKFKRQCGGYNATAIQPAATTYVFNDTYQTFNTLFTGSGANLTAMSAWGLNTTGFTYYIKLTNNFLWLACKVGASEDCIGMGLWDSLVLPTTAEIGGNAYALGTILPKASNSADRSNAVGDAFFSRLPEVTATIITGTNNDAWTFATQGWTANEFSIATSNNTNSFDKWASGTGVHVARIVAYHNITATRFFDCGGIRALLPSDFLAFRAGGTVGLGDTMTIDGNADWTVISAGAGTLSVNGLVVVTRAV